MAAIRGIGALAVVGGGVLVVAAYAAGGPTAGPGMFVPVAAGCLAMFLGGLALGWTLPPRRRPPIMRHHRLLLGLAAWSAVSFAILAGGEGVMGLIVLPIAALPEPLPEGAAAFLALALGIGLLGAVVGATYTLTAIVVLGGRWLVRRMRAASSP